MAKTGTLLLLLSLSWPLDLAAQKRLRVGDNDTVRVEFRAKLQADLRGFNPHITTEEEGFDMNRVRFGVQGRFLSHFEYEVEYEFREEFGGRPTRNPLRDAFINFDYLDDFQLKIGKFKLPFSQEQNTGSTNLDFVLRSRLADELAPAREVGAMLHGRFFNRGIGYEVGVFRHDGENARPQGDGPRGDVSFAGRFSGMPLRPLGVPQTLQNFEAAFAVTFHNTPEGLTSLRGEAYSDKEFYEPVMANGQRVRMGVDLNWTDGPFSIKGEYARVTQEREGQSVTATDLPKAIAEGWYLAGTYYVIDEKVQLAARYDELRFGSSSKGASSTSLPSRSPRAPVILKNADRAWTMGVNWFPIPYVKIQVNGIRERFTDLREAPIEGRAKYWMGIVRFQFVM